MGMLSQTKVAELNEAIRFALDIPEALRRGEDGDTRERIPAMMGASPLPRFAPSRASGILAPGRAWSEHADGTGMSAPSSGHATRP